MANVAEPLALGAEFSALQRLYLVRDPESGEGSWRAAHDFDALPEAQKAAGHWYQFENGRGVIYVDPDDNGQWFPKLPADLAAPIIKVPAVFTGPTLLERMRSIVDKVAFPKELSGLVSRLASMAEPGHDGTVVKEFGLTGFAMALSGTQNVLSYLARCAEKPLDVVMEGRWTGREAGAVLLMNQLATAIAANSAPDAPGLCRLVNLIFAPGALSLEHMAARFTCDCLIYGFTDQTLTTLNDLRKRGDDAVESAREGFFVLGHPETMPFLYYTGLFSAAPDINAAHLGYKVLGSNLALKESECKKFDRLANAAEEKLVRIKAAMLYAILDLDGSRLRLKRAEIQSLIASGKSNEAEARIMEAVDLNLFYPRPFRSVLLGEPGST